MSNLQQDADLRWSKPISLGRWIYQLYDLLLGQLNTDIILNWENGEEAPGHWSADRNWYFSLYHPI